MTCLLNCMRSWLGPIIGAALLGAVIGAMVALGIVCVPLGGIPGFGGGPAGSIGATLTCSAVALLPLLGWVLLGALAGAAVGAVVVTLIALVVCGSRCNTAASVSGVSNAADLIPVLTASPLDCDSATAAVDEIQAKLDAALDDYQSQQEVVSDRTATLNTRRNTFIAAMAALAATAFWDPFAMVAAAAAVAAAAVAVAMAASKLLAEQARLAELAALVASLQMALKTATEIKKGLCGDSSESPEEPEQPGIIDVPGINIGLLNG